MSPWIEHGVDDGAGLVENCRLDVGHGTGLQPAIAEIIDENGDIIVAIGGGIATCPRAIEHDSLEALPEQTLNAGTELFQYEIVNCHVK